MAGRILVALFLFVFLGFCIFGFIATFEPMDLGRQLIWRLFYGGAGLAAAIGIVALVLIRRTRNPQ